MYQENHSNSIQLLILGTYHELPQVLWGTWPSPQDFKNSAVTAKEGPLHLGCLRGIRMNQFLENRAGV